MQAETYILTLSKLRRRFEADAMPYYQCSNCSKINYWSSFFNACSTFLNFCNVTIMEVELYASKILNNHISTRIIIGAKFIEKRYIKICQPIYSSTGHCQVPK